MLRISFIRLYNVMGITEYELQMPKRILKLTSSNAGGKTSTIQGVLAGLTGGYDATLLRAGAEHGEVVIVIEDDRRPGEPFATIRKPLDPDAKKSGVKVKVEGYGTIGAAQSWIEDLIDIRSANPLEFLRITDKRKRAEWLLESIPLKLSAQDLIADSGLHPSEIALLAKLHPMEQLRKVEAVVTEKRRHQNVTARDRRATIQTLAGTAPRLEVDNVTPQLLEDKQVALTLAQEAKAADLAELARESAAQRSLIADESVKNYKALVAIRDAAIALATREYNEAIQIESDRKNEQLQNVSDEVQRLTNVITEQHTATITNARAELEAAQRAMQDLAKVKQSREAQEQFRREAEAAEAISEALTINLLKLAARRDLLMKQNPLPDAEVREDGEIIFKGVTFDRLNQGLRIHLAVRLAEIRAGKVGYICIDGFEAVDPEHQETLVARLLESECQCLITSVGLGPLRGREINSIDDLRDCQREDAQAMLHRIGSGE